MKKILFSVAIALLFACDSKDPQFCSCMLAGEELNDFSSKLFQQEMTQEKAAKLMELKQAEKTACADYQTMDGQEMLKRKAACNEKTKN